MKYTLEITEQELQILSAALGKLSFELVAPVIAKLQAQITEQDKAAQVDVLVESE